MNLLSVQCFVYGCAINAFLKLGRKVLVKITSLAMVYVVVTTTTTTANDLNGSVVSAWAFINLIIHFISILSDRCPYLILDAYVLLTSGKQFIKEIFIDQMYNF